MAEGATLAALRSSAGLSQSEIAERLHISVPAVSETEHRDYVRPDTAERYVQAAVTAIREKAIKELLGEYMVRSLGAYAREIVLET